jgi:hypothetical protein
MTIQEKNNRIVAAYRKMTGEGQDALDRIIGKLAEAHRPLFGILPLKRDEMTNMPIKGDCR